MTVWKPDIVIYHDHCADGFGAAWACWMRWPEAEFVPANYGQEPPLALDKHVLIVDFSYKRAGLIDLGNRASSVVILDHHKTAEADLAPFAVTKCGDAEFVVEDVQGMLRDLCELNRPQVLAFFDMDCSGARLAWNFCHAGEAPLLIRLIEDRDLWRFTMEDTKPFSLWLRSEAFSFVRFELLAQELHDARDCHEIMTEARAMQRFFDAKVDEIASFATTRRVGSFDAITVNCPPMFASEVGHILLDKHPEAPFAATYFDGPKARMWSLRSRDDREDVSVIASKFGGGGHRNAAGFGTPL